MPAPYQQIRRDGGPEVGDEVKLHAIQKRSERGSKTRDYPDFRHFVMTDKMGRVMWHYTSTVHQCFKGVRVSGVVKEIYSAKIFFGEPFQGGTVDDHPPASATQRVAPESSVSDASASEASNPTRMRARGTRIVAPDAPGPRECIQSNTTLSGAASSSPPPAPTPPPRARAIRSCCP